MIGNSTIKREGHHLPSRGLALRIKEWPVGVNQVFLLTKLAYSTLFVALALLIQFYTHLKVASHSTLLAQISPGLQESSCCLGL